MANVTRLSLVSVPDALLADGVRVLVFIRVLVFSLRSPSVMPGGTPCAGSDAELDRFPGNLRACFDFFLREFGGRATPPLGGKDRLMRISPPGTRGG